MNIISNKIEDINKYLKNLEYIRYRSYIDGIFSDNLNENFYNKYMTMTSDEIRKYKCGVCWDTSHMIYLDLIDIGLNAKEIYFVCYDPPTFPTHSFTIFNEFGKWRICEYSWEKLRGISKPFSSMNEICEYYSNEQNKYLNQLMNIDSDRYMIFYDISGKSHPGYHKNCDEYMTICEKQEIMYIHDGISTYK